MCAILDANVVGEVFGKVRTAAGNAFLKWLNKGKGRLRLVSGGTLHEELSKSMRFREWALEAIRGGVMKRENADAVNKRTEELRREGACASDDPHVLALAQVSGARLLYSNDSALQRDFKKKSLIDNPRGKVYSTLENQNFLPSHRRLLANRNLCRLRDN